jgi:hypothetical protein
MRRGPSTGTAFYTIPTSSEVRPRSLSVEVSQGRAIRGDGPFHWHAQRYDDVDVGPAFEADVDVGMAVAVAVGVLVSKASPESIAA